MIPPAPDVPLPDGWRVVLDRDVRVRGEVVVGGVPRRALRLTASGVRVLDELRVGPVAAREQGLLARRLVAAGLAVPRPPTGAPSSDCVVVVPVRDRTAELDRCLAASAGAPPVVVVDDGSRRPAEVAAVVRDHGAELVTRPTCGGPAAARNTALTELRRGERPPAAVAFVDSDVEVEPGWLPPLLAHLADPAVAAVAPRVRSADPALVSPLDLGRTAGDVRAWGRLPYVPSAALVVRLGAFGGFDEELRYGEDVDAVWRLTDAGWSVRYVPDVVVRHAEPTGLAARAARRFRYGTSAGPLARRHPGRLAPAVLSPAPTVAVLAAASGRPRLAALAAATTGAQVGVRLRSAGLPVRDAPRLSVGALISTATGLGRWAGGAGLPAAVALTTVRPRLGAGLTALVAATSLADTATRTRPSTRGLTDGLLGSAAYGAGVWWSALQERTLEPVRPRVLRGPSARTLRPRTPRPSPPTARPRPGRPASRTPR